MAITITKNEVEKVKAPSKPYITINKLAEYMTANATRRKSIIKTLKNEDAFTAQRYSAAKNVVLRYFKSGYDNAILDAAVNRIKAKTPITEWEKNDNKNSVLALESMKGTPFPNLTNYTINSNVLNIKQMILGGITVYLKPEICVQNNKTGAYGLFKMHFSKNNALEEKNRIYAATLLKFALINSGYKVKEIEAKLCMSHDVFLGEYNPSSKTYIRIIREMEAACREIASSWDRI